MIAVLQAVDVGSLCPCPREFQFRKAICVSVCVCMIIYVYVYMCVYIYIYIYIYIHTYIHTHTPYSITYHIISKYSILHNTQGARGAGAPGGRLGPASGYDYCDC